MTTPAETTETPENKLTNLTLQDIDDDISALLGGEPVFTLRAQDALAAGLVTAWAVTAAKLGTPAAKVARAFAIAKAMNAWPKQKIPD